MKTISELLKESLGASVKSNFQIVLTEKFDLTADEVRDSKNWRTPTEQLALVKELVKAGKLKSTGKTTCELEVNGLTVEFKIFDEITSSKSYKSRGADGLWDKPKAYWTKKKQFPDYFAELYLSFNVKGDPSQNATEVLLKRFNTSKLEHEEKQKLVATTNKKIKLLGLSFDENKHW